MELKNLEFYKIILSFVLAILLAGTGYFLFHRNPSEKLNQLFLGAFEAYAVFFIFDGLIGLMYANALLVDFCRDVSSAFGLIGHTFVFLGSLYVLRGETIINDLRFLIPFLLYSLCAIILGQLNDWVIVDVATQSYVLDRNLIGLFFNYIYHAILIFLALVSFLRVYLETENPDIKRRLKLLIVGLCVVVFGQLIQLILSSLLTEPVYYALILPDTFVYSLWAVGVLIILRGFWK